MNYVNLTLRINTRNKLLESEHAIINMKIKMQLTFEKKKSIPIIRFSKKNSTTCETSLML